MRMGKPVCCLLVLGVILSSTSVIAAEVVTSKKSKVTFGGSLHAQFYTSSLDTAVEATSTFFVRRARISASYVNGSGSMKGRVEYDLAEAGAKLKDGYLEVKLCTYSWLRVGQFKKPFSLWELTSTTKTMVIERGNSIKGSGWKASNQVLVESGLYAGRDIGASLHGKVEMVKYSVGVFNGNGYNKETDDDNGKLFGGRLVISPVKVAALGVSFSNRMISDYVDTAGDTSDMNFQAFDVDLEVGTKGDVSKTGPWLQAEFDYGSNPVTETTKFMGIAVMGSYNIKLPDGAKAYSIRPAVRFDLSQPDVDDNDSQTMLITPGLDIFLDKYNRLQLNVDLNMPSLEDAGTEIAVRVQFQMHI